MQLEYSNPPLEAREFYQVNSPTFEVMTNLLQNEVAKAQRIYYCGTHHSIETVDTVTIHQNGCTTYTRGMLFSRFNFISLIVLALDKKQTMENLIELAKQHGHADQDGKIRAILFSKNLPHAQKIQQKKEAKKNINANNKSHEMAIEEDGVIPNIKNKSHQPKSRSRSSNRQIDLEFEEYEDEEDEIFEKQSYKMSRSPGKISKIQKKELKTGYHSD